MHSLSEFLGLSSTGRHDEHAERILNFLMNPIDEGKSIPEIKKSTRNSTKPSTRSKASTFIVDSKRTNVRLLVTTEKSYYNSFISRMVTTKTLTIRSMMNMMKRSMMIETMITLAAMKRVG